MKTKETNPTRPGPPTPCKQALSKGFFGLMGGCISYKGGPSRGMPPGKILKFWSLKVHFQHSEAKSKN